MSAPGLQKLRLFSGIPEEQRVLLEAGAQRKSFKRGEVIFHKGDEGNTMFIILSGQVKIVLPSDGGGEEALLGQLDSGDFFGELSLIDGQPRSATIVASEPTETLVLHRDHWLAIVHSYPTIAINMLQVLAGRLRETDSFVEDAIFLDVPGRLAKKLLELASSYGIQTPNGTMIGLRLTQQEIARMVGATRESVNKHLRSYRARGIIDMIGQRIVIRRRDELQRRIY